MISSTTSRSKKLTIGSDATCYKIDPVARCRKSIRMEKQHESTETNDARSQTTQEARYFVMRFSRSLHPRGMTMVTPPQYATPIRYEVPTRVTASSLRDCALCHHLHGYNNGLPLIFIRSPATEFDTKSTPTAKYNSTS
jgi:hypothetical protein